MESVERYAVSFKEAEGALSKVGPEWAHEMRRAALASFREQGFPGLRNEAWRGTRVRPIAEIAFSRETAYKPNGLGADRIREMTFDDTGAHRLVIVDGHYAPDLSDVKTLPDGVWIGSLADALAEIPDRVERHLGKHAQIGGAPFVALNTAFLADGVFVHVPDGVALEAPVHVVWAANSGSPTVSHTRALFVVEKNAAVDVVESYIGTGEGVYLTNAVTEFVCGANADVNHCKIQRERQTAFHVATLQTLIGPDARFSTENITVGGALTRNDVNSVLDGEGIDCRIDGLYLANERQHVDNHTFIRHAQPHCHSFELYKGILAGRSRGVFNGKIYVDPDAQKTDAKQSNNCILLSDDARINTNPQLEIFADDVKCTHGATVGQLDEDAVFYLRSRGIDDTEARHVLLHAFANEVLDRVKVDAARAKLETDLSAWLDEAYAAAEE